MLTLTVEKRTKQSPGANALRRAGSIPGIVYGPHQEATPLALDARTFSKTLREAGESSLLTLTGLGTDVLALVHEVDLDPISNEPRHVDFYAVTKGENVQVAVPLEFVGESLAVKTGANLVKVLYELEVEADPMKLPREITVDISRLAAIDDQIVAGDLVLPDGVTLAIDPEEVVALAQAVEEEEETTGGSIDDIEVEKKGKEEAEA